MTRCLALVILAATVGSAQRNEVSLQFGGTLTQRRTIAVPAEFRNVLGTNELREENGLAGGLVYRVRLVSFGPAAVLAEIPIFIVQATNTDLIPVIARPIFGDTSGVSGFITPGVAIRFLPRARLSPYVFAGAGYARVLEARIVSVSSIRPIRGSFEDEGTWAINYGGGADLRLSRLLSLRGELRNFYTGETGGAIRLVEEIRQRNTLLITGGIAFHF